MKALTLTQPWASLVAVGPKRIETRSWQTGYRGELAIHAAKGLNGIAPGAKLDDLRVLCDDPMFSAALWPDRSDGSQDRHPADDLPRGALVATCLLEQVIPTYSGPDQPEPKLLFSHIWDDDPDEIELLRAEGWWMDAEIPVAHFGQRPFGNFEPGRFAWMLADVVPLGVPVEIPRGVVRDYRGLWDVPPEVEAAMLPRAAHSQSQAAE